MKTPSIARFVDLPLPFQLKRKDLLGASAHSIEFKAASIGEVKLEDGGGRATICGAFVGNADSGGDVCEAGCFQKSMRERVPKRLIKQFLLHEEPLGEADRVWMDGDRLFSSGPIPDNAVGSQFRSWVKSGAIAHGSIGYIPIQAKREERDGETVRVLTEVKLFEVSGVIWPMNEMAEGIQLAKSSGGLFSRKSMDCKHPASLWEVSDVLGMLASLRWYLRYYELDPADAEIARMVIDQLAGAQTELATLLHIEPEPEAKAAEPEIEVPAPVAEATTPEEPLADGDQELKQLLDRLEMVTAGAHLQLQRSKGWASHGAGRNPRG